MKEELHHSHGVIDPVVATSQRGIWAIQWSFVVLFLTAIIQVVVVYFSGSVGLMADTIHNFGDALTALPLWVAFRLAHLKPNKRFSFGYGRLEDLAGIVIVMIVLASAILATYQSIQRMLHPHPLSHLGAVVLASVIGFLGNEAVAIIRIRVGKEIDSAALVADGQHARIDGWTSLAVLFGSLGVWFGYPLADPLVGLVITAAIFGIVWQSGKAVLIRVLVGVDPKVIDALRHEAKQVSGVQQVMEVRARWVGHRLYAEVNIAVSPKLSVAEGHGIAKEVYHQLIHHLAYLSSATIHVDPSNEAGERHHEMH